MLEKIFRESNNGCISGIIEDELKYDHGVLGEKFYKTRVRVKRLNETEDHIPLIVSNLLISNDHNESLKGKYVEVSGQFRSWNRDGADGRRHLDVFLFAKTIDICESEECLEEVENENLIYLDGYICKEPIYRITPLGRKIADLMIAVNRRYNKSDYIPCIAWENDALYASGLDVGTRIRLYGRMQSRQYFKRFSPMSEDGEIRETYEVSIINLMTV